jgi:hypothetical protein
MPATLSCTISKITTLPNKVNADIVAEYRKYMCDNGASEHHQNNALKAVIGYAKFLGENTTFYDINTKEQIIAYLDTKMNSAEQDPDKKWITTWNDNFDLNPSDYPNEAVNQKVGRLYFSLILLNALPIKIYPEKLLVFRFESFISFRFDYIV